MDHEYVNDKEECIVFPDRISRERYYDHRVSVVPNRGYDSLVRLYCILRIKCARQCPGHEIKGTGRKRKNAASARCV